jgi:hypothetical protein
VRATIQVETDLGNEVRRSRTGHLHARQVEGQVGTTARDGFQLELVEGDVRQRYGVTARNVVEAEESGAVVDGAEGCLSDIGHVDVGQRPCGVVEGEAHEPVVAVAAAQAVQGQV